MSYCLLADLKGYLNIGTSDTSDDALLQRLLDAANSHIDSKCQRTFQAASDTTRYFDPALDVMNGELWLDDDLSNVTSIVNGDGTTLAASDWYHNPRNYTPWYSLGLMLASTKIWTYTNSPQNSISITGRWAYMTRFNATAFSRVTGIVTATIAAPGLIVGQTVYVVNVADSSFNGAFTVTANTGTTVTWAQAGVDDTDTTGTLLFTPADIVQACRRLAAWLYRQKDTQQSGTSTPLFAADGTVVMPSIMPVDVVDLLRPYLRTL